VHDPLWHPSHCLVGWLDCIRMLALKQALILLYIRTTNHEVSLCILTIFSYFCPPSLTQLE